MNQKFIDIARVELGETETKKEQSLAHLRSWLSKHPFLSKTRQDDVYLLQFLRNRKYSMDATFETIENSYLAQKICPDLCCFESGEFKRIFKMIDSGVVIPLPTRDFYGRKIVLLRAARLDTNIYTPADELKFIICCFSLLLEEEETQIAGFITIADFEGYTLRHLPSPSHLRELMMLTKKTFVVRQKATLCINLPSFASFVVDSMKLVMTEKLGNRLVVLKCLDDLAKEVDASLMPKEYGGKQPLAEMLQAFKETALAKGALLSQLTMPQVDWKNVSPGRLNPNGDRETVGSFRKLEID